MTTDDLIVRLALSMPHVLRSEIADALDVEPHFVNSLLRRNNVLSEKKGKWRGKDHSIIAEIEAKANEIAGGRVEIIVKTNGAILCVDGRVADEVAA